MVMALMNKFMLYFDVNMAVIAVSVNVVRVSLIIVLIYLFYTVILFVVLL